MTAIAVYLLNFGTTFTGENQARLARLLAFLALLSIVIWGMVILSMMLRFGARAIFMRKHKPKYLRSRA
jgi:putative flippase GtrA